LGGEFLPFPTDRRSMGGLSFVLDQGGTTAYRQTGQLCVTATMQPLETTHAGTLVHELVWRVAVFWERDFRSGRADYRKN
jgi:hypothetical protein